MGVDFLIIRVCRECTRQSSINWSTFQIKSGFIGYQYKIKSEGKSENNKCTFSLRAPRSSGKGAVE